MSQNLSSIGLDPKKILLNEAKSSTANAIPKFSDTTGVQIEASNVTIDSSGNISGVAGFSAASLDVDDLTLNSSALVTTPIPGKIENDGSSLYYTDDLGARTALGAGGGSGDVTGPASATDNALARFDTVSGKLIQNSTALLTDAGALSGVTDLTATGQVSSGSFSTSGAAATGALTVTGNASATGTITGANLPAPTAAGDLVVGSGAGTASLLPVGTNTQVLTVVAGAPTWQTPSSGGSGDVTGPSSSINAQMPYFSGTTGKVIAASLATLSSAGILSVPSSSSTTPDSGVFVDGGTGTGIFSSTAGVLTLRANNNNTFTMTSTTGLSAGNTGGASMRSSSSSAANPAHTFTGNLTSGLYSQSGIVGISAFGVAAITTNSSQRVGIGTATATASLHIQKAGVATASGAPLKIDSGTLLTTPESGAIENDGTSLYYTNGAGTRVALGSGGGGSGDVVGPASSVDGQISLFSGTTGKLLKASTNVIDATNRLGIGITPTANLHIKAGTTAAGTAAMKFATGVLMTAAEAGSLEFDGANLWLTNSTPTRFRLGNVLGPFTTAANFVPTWSNTTTSLQSSLVTIDANGMMTLPTAYAYGLVVGSTKLSEASTGNLVVTANGTISARFGAATIYSSNNYSMYISSLNVGSAAAPTYAFAGDQTSGLWSNASGIYLAKGGTNGLSMDTSRNVTLAAGLVTSGYQTRGFTAPGAYPYTVLATDYTIMVNTTAARTITLPSTTTSGRVVVVKDLTGSAGTNAITVSAGGVVLIDAATSYSITTNYGAASFQWNGTKWVIISASSVSPSSGPVKLSAQVASASAGLIFTGLDSTYNRYEFIATDLLPATNGANFVAQYSTDGGSTWITTGTYGTTTTTTVASGSFTSTFVLIGAGATGNGAGSSGSGKFTLANPSSTATYKYLYGQFGSISNVGGLSQSAFMGTTKDSTSAVNAIKFFFSSGNITSGSMTMYGVNDS